MKAVNTFTRVTSPALVAGLSAAGSADSLLFEPSTGRGEPRARPASGEEYVSTVRTSRSRFRDGACVLRRGAEDFRERAEEEWSAPQFVIELVRGELMRALNVQRIA
jgi:hypothetical protein